VIAEKLEAEAVPFAGEMEVHESYFGGVRKGPEVVGRLEKFPCLGSVCVAGHRHPRKNSPAHYPAENKA